MTDEERKELEQDYENLKILLEFHSTYGVPENPKEMQKIVDELLDEMLKIKRQLKQ